MEEIKTVTPNELDTIGSITETVKLLVQDTDERMKLTTKKNWDANLQSQIDGNNETRQAAELAINPKTVIQQKQNDGSSP